MNYIHQFIERLPRRIILLAALAIVSTLTACQTHKVPIDVSSAQSIEKDARAHLHVGSTEADVVTYLDQRGIDYHWKGNGEPVPGNSTSNYHEPGWGALGYPTLTAFIPLAVPNTNLKGSILDFRFDHTKSALIDIAVHDVHSP